MNSAAESITKLIGEAQTHDQLRSLLNEVANGDQEKVRCARKLLKQIPGVSTEFLATLQVAIRLDEFSASLSVLQKRHNEIHGAGGRGCPSLRIEVEKMQKAFFRGVCVCLFVPIVLWTLFSVAQFLWRR